MGNLKLKIVFLFVINSLLTYSQITVSDVSTHKRQELVIEKPEPYDSLTTWQDFSNPIEYNIYIGQRVYLPSFKGANNKDKTTDSYGLVKIGNFNDRPFLFYTDYNKYEVNRENVLSEEMINIKYTPGNISSSYHTDFQLHSLTTNVYKPIINTLEINPYSNRYNFRVGNNTHLGDRYFQIIDVLYEDKLNMNLYRDSESGYTQHIGVVNFTTTPIEGRRKITEEKSTKLNISRGRITVAYLLKDELTGDTVIYAEPGRNRFILVSYFVKQQELFEGKYFINRSSYTQIGNVRLARNSRWLCKSVTIASTTGTLTYVLENEKQDILTLNRLDGFILEDVIKKEEEEQRMLAKELEEIQKRALIEREERERIAIENRRRVCIEKFGRERGLIIANRQVQLGMTREMCEYAWGEPILINKTTNEHGVFEVWHFGFIRALHFHNGILKSIEE